jgi:hypothetical protein
MPPGGSAGVPAGGAGRVAASAWGVGPATDVLADVAAEHVAADAAADLERDQWPDRPEVSYLDDPAAFERDYREARARRRRGEDAVPYMTEDATGGLGARDGGRPFGVELEFDIKPGVDPYTAKAAIGRDLHAAGLTRSPRQEGWHHQAPSEDHQGGWRYETDSTVHGEIVSPIMYDEPDTWQNLAKVCEIVRRHGGIASARTGGHIHVGLHDYDHTVERHNRLLSMAAGHQDTLYRLASNPDRRDHRGLYYCRPNQDPGRGYSSISSVRASNQGHSPGIGINFGNVHGQRTDHVEYRMWDGSLNPGVIQAQVNLSLGMTAAAARGGFTPPRAERVGSHLASNPGRRQLRGEAWRESTRNFRQLADTVFRRAANSAQAAALFAATRWQHDH